MRSEGGGFAANIYGAMPESRIQVTSHLRLLIPSHSSLATHPCFQTSGFRVVEAASLQYIWGDARRPEDRSHMSDVS